MHKRNISVVNLYIFGMFNSFSSLCERETVKLLLKEVSTKNNHNNKCISVINYIETLFILYLEEFLLPETMFYRLLLGCSQCSGSH